MATSTVVPVKRDIALRVAATQVEGLSVDDAKAVVDTFLQELARCAVCDDERMITVPHDMRVELKDTGQFPHRTNGLNVQAGESWPCPNCGNPPGVELPAGDPHWVSWRCVQGDGHRQCAADRTSQREEDRERHDQCGLFVGVPRDSL